SVRSTVRPAGGLPGRSAASTELARPGRHRRPAFVVPNEGPRGLTRSPGRARWVWATVDVSRNLGRKERTMRRITGGLIAAALALGTTLGVYGTTARAATAYDSAYQFESAFLSLNSGDIGTFSVFFANTATTASQLSVTPAYPANEDNQISTTVPGNGQHTYTFTTSLTGTLTFAVLDSKNIVQNSDLTYSFCDTNQDKKGDGVGAGATFVTAINGIAVPNSSIVINQAIPSNGTITVTIDSATPNERVRLV